MQNDILKWQNLAHVCLLHLSSDCIPTIVLWFCFLKCLSKRLIVSPPDQRNLLKLFLFSICLSCSQYDQLCSDYKNWIWYVKKPALCGKKDKGKIPKNNQNKMAGGTRLSRKCVPLQLYYTWSVVGFYQANWHLIHKDQKVFQSAHT